MMNNEMKMPANFAAIDAEEMTYLVGGTDITTTDGWKTFINVGQVFNYIARVFSASSSIINNISTIVNSVYTLNTLFSTLFGGTKTTA